MRMHLKARRSYALCVSLILWLAATTAVHADTVVVKYRGPVDLAPFSCDWITRSSFIQRLCYDRRERYVIVNLNGVYYHYCDVPASVVNAWRQADSLGRFYNSFIKGSFDCRINRMPAY